jgi:predicted transcriptional regulator of viral defense system
MLSYLVFMPTDRFAELAELAADQYGLFTLADAATVGYAPNTIAQMARRNRLERVSQGVYRISFLPIGALGSYMEAALWPVSVKGVLSHETALDLWDVCDVNPGKVHISVPRAHRPQRQLPNGYVIHREDFSEQEIAAIEGIPVVTLALAVAQCAADHVGPDLLEQAVRTGRAHGLLSAEQAATLMRDFRLDRVAGARA